MYVFVCSIEYTVQLQYDLKKFLLTYIQITSLYPNFSYSHNSKKNYIVT